MTGKIDPLFANHPDVLAMEKQSNEFMDGLRRDMRNAGLPLARPTVDIKCYQLAAHFISDVDVLNDTLDAEQYRCELAAHIQSKIEDWITTEIQERAPISPKCGNGEIPNVRQEDWDRHVAECESPSADLNPFSPATDMGGLDHE